MKTYMQAQLDRLNCSIINSNMISIKLCDGETETNDVDLSGTEQEQKELMIFIESNFIIL